jgi:ribosomal protein S12 methylthiotransferase
MAQNKIRIGMISLGCPKTLVDSETILGKLPHDRYELTLDPEKSDIVLLNTCGFIHDAQKESIDTLCSLSDQKRQGTLQAIIVIGCLVQDHAKTLQKKFPEVDAFVGTGDYASMAALVDRVVQGHQFLSADRAGYLASASEPRVALTPAFTRYLKIAEGCNHACSFCLIPRLRGRYRSRTIVDVLSEAEKLENEGARELI